MKYGFAGPLTTQNILILFHTEGEIVDSSRPLNKNYLFFKFPVLSL